MPFKGQRQVADEEMISRAFAMQLAAQIKDSPSPSLCAMSTILSQRLCENCSKNFSPAQRRCQRNLARRSGGQNAFKVGENAGEVATNTPGRYKLC